MKNIISIVTILIASICLSYDKAPVKGPRILVFSKTAGFRHSSIPQGKSAILQLGLQNSFAVDTSEDASLFTATNLKKYAAVVFMNTTGNILNNEQQAAFEQYIRSGGGYAGVHAATDTEYDWAWYEKLAGAYFLSHPAIQDAKLNIVMHDHISTRHLPDEWNRKDEWYNFKDLNPDVTVLITIDENSYTGGKNGSNHPVSWYHKFDGGRAWYTALGHTETSYAEENFLKHLLGGILYAMDKK